MRIQGALATTLAVAASLLQATAVHAARGGPDGGGWAWADSNEVGISASVDAPATWTTIGVEPLPKDVVYAVPLSFPVTLYGVTSSTVWVSSNGWLSLRDPRGAAVPLNAPIPSNTAPNTTFAFAWDDMGAWFLTYLRYGSTPQGDLIEFNMQQSQTTSWATGTIEFYRNGSIKVLYHANPSLVSLTIGIEDGTGTYGSQIVYNGTLAPGVSFNAPYAILFHPPGQPLDCSAAILTDCPTPIAGTTLGAASDVDFYSCDGLSWTGGERVYRFEQRRAGPFRASLSGLGGRNLSLFLLEAGCNPNWGCRTGGSATIDIPALAIGWYDLVVDAASAADDGSFTLVVNANDLDCNQNGNPDRCDIRAGTSEDCNLDGRPDECGRCPIDVVFTMDTSGSMGGAAAQLCTEIAATIATLAAQGIDFRAFIWGITSTGFGCLVDSVTNQLGNVVPGPPTPLPPLDILNHEESWAQATAVVAALFPWAPNAQRVVVPISDEGPFQGDPVNDPGDDRDAVMHAISVSLAHGVIASPITPDHASPAVVQLAQDLAAGTGGLWFSLGTASGGIGQAIIDLAGSACAGAGATANAGPDQELCASSRITLDGSGSTPACTGGLEFRWLEGSTEVCPWSSVATCDVTPGADTTYTLEVRCLQFPTCLFTDSMDVRIVGAPPPGSLGNTLLAVRSGATELAIQWATVPGATTYNLYRGVQKGVWPVALLTGLPATVTLPDIPGPPFLFFYRATGVGCGEAEGP